MKIAFYLIFFLPFYVFGQANYQPGNVVTNDGDTLFGYIDYKEWYFAPTSISFSETADGNATKQMGINDLIYFGINNAEEYIKETIPISIDEVELEKISMGIDTRKEVRTLFLKILQSGKYISLYSYRDDIKNRFYVRETGGEIHELIYRRYRAKVLNPNPMSLADSTERVVVSTIYRNQLYELANKYSSDLVGRISTSSYSTNSLLRIMSELNGIDFRAARSGSRLNLFVGGGVSIGSSLEREATFNGWSEKASAPSSYKMLINVGADFFLNPNTRRFFFRAELVYTTYDHTGYPQFNQSTIALAPSLNYRIFNGGNVKFFLGGGSKANFSSYPGGYPTSQIGKSGYFGLKGFWLTLSGHAGIVVLDKVEFAGRYDLPAYITRFNSNIEIREACLQIGARYLF